MEALNHFCHTISDEKAMALFLEHTNPCVVGIDFEIEATIRMSTSKQECQLEKRQPPSSDTNSILQRRRPPLQDITTSPQQEDDISHLTMTPETQSSASESTLSTVSITRSSATTSTTETFSKPLAHLEERQRKLLGVVHSVACTHDPVATGRTCSDVKHCAAVKRVTTHAVNCRNKACMVPSCRKLNKLWRHFLACRNDATCSLCVVIPMETRTQVRNLFGIAKVTEELSMAEANSQGSLSISSSSSQSSCRSSEPEKKPRTLKRTLNKAAEPVMSMPAAESNVCSRPLSPPSTPNDSSASVPPMLPISPPQEPKTLLSPAKSSTRSPTSSSLSAPLSPVSSNNGYAWPQSTPLSPRRPPLSPRKQLAIPTILPGEV